MVPASDGLDNFVGISGPREGLWFGVVFDDEAFDGGLQVNDRYEDAAFQSPLCELGEKALEKAPSSGAFLPASLIYYFSGEPIHFCSGVDTMSRFAIDVS